MKISLARFYKAPWGVDGELFIGGRKVADTVEHPTACLPEGTYPITLSQLVFNRNNGPMRNRDGSICIGRRVCSGCVIRTEETFWPLYFRIQKALKRHSHVLLTIGKFPTKKRPDLPVRAF